MLLAKTPARTGEGAPGRLENGQRGSIPWQDASDPSSSPLSFGRTAIPSASLLCQVTGQRSLQQDD